MFSSVPAFGVGRSPSLGKASQLWNFDFAQRNARREALQDLCGARLIAPIRASLLDDDTKRRDNPWANRQIKNKILKEKVHRIQSIVDYFDKL